MKRHCAKFRPLCTSVPCVIVTFIVTLTGGLLALFWTDIFNHIVASSLRLKPDSVRFLIWRDTPVPNYLDFYFFNWTNPEDILKKGVKPRFQELGPYRFLESRLKTDIVWNYNDTITYKQNRKWQFDSENSNGSLSDQVTTINIIALSAAYVLRDWNYFLLMPFSQMLKNKPLAITHPVSEYLFDGFDDPLINLGRLGSIFDRAIQMPHDKFGWFYQRNGSSDYDGVFNMATGVQDMAESGLVKSWNYRNSTKFYPEHCGRVSGFTGEVFPTQRQKETFELYFQDICRSMYFDFSSEVNLDDIPSYQYTASPINLDNGTLDPGNACYCGGKCVPSGVLNVSTCKYGAPAFVSYPHFYQADPFYLDQVEGLVPDKEKHSFQIFIEPKTGIPIDMFARLQVNLLVQPYSSISLLANLPKVFFPMMWFEQRIRATPELSTTLQYMLVLSPVGLIASLTTFTIGLALFLAVTYSRCYKKYLPDTAMKQLVEVVSPLIADHRDVALTEIRRLDVDASPMLTH